MRFVFAIIMLFLACSHPLKTIPLQDRLPASPVPFYFIQISDIHWGDSVNNHRLKQVASSIARLPVRPDFILITGDMMRNPSSLAELNLSESPWKDLDLPVYFTPGNHDITFQDTTSIAQYRKIFGSPETTFTFNSIRWFGFNSAWMPDSLCIPCPKILDDLGQKMSSVSLPKILFTHIPPGDNFYRNNFHEGWHAPFREQLDSILSTHKVIAMLCGHFHRDEMAKSGNIPVFIAGPVAQNLGRQAQYRLYRWDQGILTYSTIFVEDEK